MNKNNDITYALNYHELTKHSKILNNYSLDWDNKPLTFKFYKDLISIPLPIDFPYPKKETLVTLNRTISEFDGTNKKINKKLLAQLLFFSYGVNRKIKTDYGIYFTRTASATGALYPTELYLSCFGISGIKNGLYHFCPGTFTISPIRYGDYRYILYKQIGNKDFISSKLVFIVTSIVYRNSWKYRDRSYRHLFWDSGVIISNLLAVCSANSLPVKIFMGFIDTEINRLLCLTSHELVICLIAVGKSFKKSVVVSNTKSIHHEIIESQLKYNEYPEIYKIHDASSLSSIDDIDNWIQSGRDFLNNNKNNIKNNTQKYPVKFDITLKTNLDDTILLRGSTRRFANKSISYQKLCNILHVSLNQIPFDFIKGNNSLIDVYFIINKVDNLSSGGYYYNKTKKQIECIKNDVLYGDSGYLCLSQQLFNNASVVFFLMTNLNNVLSILGNRGYRCCQFEAGIITGKIYLSSYAQGLGASGSTFYDDHVSNFFAPHANHKNTMIAVGIGIPNYISKKGKVLSGRLTRSDLLNSL